MLRTLIWQAAVVAAAVASADVSLGQTMAQPGTFEVLGAMPGSSDGVVRRKHRSPDSVVFSLEPSQGTHLQKRVVPFDRAMAAGSILVQTKVRRLYFVLGNGEAIEYPVGVGKQGFTWSGTNRISRKAEWPTWRPPAVMIAREAKKGRQLPEEMEGGLGNPLGARALYIGQTEFRIHGTTQPWSIGKAVSSGCIRMLNEHVIDLYDKVEIGAQVVVE